MTDRTLTDAQVAEALNVPRSMVKRLRDRRLLPYIKIGYRTIRYRMSDVQAYMARNGVAAIRKTR